MKDKKIVIGGSKILLRLREKSEMLKGYIKLEGVRKMSERLTQQERVRERWTIEGWYLVREKKRKKWKTDRCNLVSKK